MNGCPLTRKKGSDVTVAINGNRKDLVVMEILCVLTMPMSAVPRDTVLQFCKILSLAGAGNGHMGTLCSISYNCIGFCHYAKIKRLIIKSKKKDKENMSNREGHSTQR